MKCECEECDGTGSVKCQECGGTGKVEVAWINAPIPKNHTHRAELEALKQDVQRVRKQAQELRTLNPSRSGSYSEQEIATIASIERQARRLI